MSQPWQALEQLNDVATSHLSWRQLLGDTFDSHCDLSCRSKTSLRHCQFPIVRTSGWKLSRSRMVSSKATTRRPRSTFRSIDATSFATSSALKARRRAGFSVGYDMAFERLGGPMYRYRLGHYGNPNGSGFSLFLAKVSDPRRLDWCIDAFLAEFQRPFVLFLTSKKMLSSRNETMLESRGSCGSARSIVVAQR